MHVVTRKKSGVKRERAGGLSWCFDAETLWQDDHTRDYLTLEIAPHDDDLAILLPNKNEGADVKLSPEVHLWKNVNRGTMVPWTKQRDRILCAIALYTPASQFPLLNDVERCCCNRCRRRESFSSSWFVCLINDAESWQTTESFDIIRQLQYCCWSMDQYCALYILQCSDDQCF